MTNERSLWAAAYYTLTMVVGAVLLLPVWIVSYFIGFYSRAAHAAWTRGYVVMEELEEMVHKHLKEHQDGDDT
jgi:hypothetical protein